MRLCTFEVRTSLGRHLRLGAVTDGGIVDLNFACAWHLSGKGTYEEEHGLKGFYGKSAHLYHAHPPTGWTRFQGKLRPHCLDLNQPSPADRIILERPAVTRP